MTCYIIFAYKSVDDEVTCWLWATFSACMSYLVPKQAVSTQCLSATHAWKNTNEGFSGWKQGITTPFCDQRQVDMDSFALQRCRLSKWAVHKSAKWILITFRSLRREEPTRRTCLAKPTTESLMSALTQQRKCELSQVTPVHDGTWLRSTRAAVGGWVKKRERQTEKEKTQLIRHTRKKKKNEMIHE